jgi:UDP-sulfoquinovose synthase
VYGSGGQTRGFLDIRDTVRCIELACATPAKVVEYRVFNQFTEQFSVLQLAELVRDAGLQHGIPVTIEHLADPRVEAEQHYYNAAHTKLTALGLTPHLLSRSIVDSIFEVVMKYQKNVDPSVLRPTVDWRRTQNERSRGKSSRRPSGPGVTAAPSNGAASLRT